MCARQSGGREAWPVAAHAAEASVVLVPVNDEPSVALARHHWPPLRAPAYRVPPPLRLRRGGLARGAPADDL